MLIKIDRPLVEIEVPEFIIFTPEEIEAEKIRILNSKPMPYMTAAQKKRMEKIKQKKMLKAQEVKMPEWMLEDDLEKAEPAVQAAAAQPV